VKRLRVSESWGRPKPDGDSCGGKRRTARVKELSTTMGKKTCREKTLERKETGKGRFVVEEITLTVVNAGTKRPLPSRKVGRNTHLRGVAGRGEASLDYGESWDNG